ncbi:MAG: hypothetical protein ACRCYQ_11860 [Nocardioides sp.]
MSGGHPANRRDPAPPRHRYPGLVIAVATAILGAGLTACGGHSGVIPPEVKATRLPQDEAAKADPDALGLPLDPMVLLQSTGGEQLFTQRGSAPVRIRVVSRDGGEVELEPGLDGSPAVRFPSFVAGDRYPRAVVLVENDGKEDRLSPGSRDFVWGADFKVDDVSSGSTADNGDNLIQRGLFVHPAQFKAELDGRRASCSVLGDRGRLKVRASEDVEPGRWYRVRCERSGDEIAVYVTEFGADGTTRSYASRESGPIGDITMDPTDTPMTIGGKIGADGEVLRDASDQLNGWVANPVYAIQ